MFVGSEMLWRLAVVEVRAGEVSDSLDEVCLSLESTCSSRFCKGGEIEEDVGVSRPCISSGQTRLKRRRKKITHKWPINLNVSEDVD